MPVSKSAKKAWRRDRRRAGVNAKIRLRMKTAVRGVKKNPGQKSLTAAYRRLDIAAKGGVIHKNKAARLKARLAKKLSRKKLSRRRSLGRKSDCRNCPRNED